MKEWQGKYNPFNSWKALTHSANFEAILEGEPLPPIVVNMDLTNECNYKCGFCMFGGDRERADKTSETFRKGNASLPEGYAQTLPKLWKDWGVKAVCLAGGGEPTLHPDCLEFIVECDKQGLDLGFVTNGNQVSEEWWDKVAKHTKFVGFSMDAGNETDYAKVKGVKPDNFYKVLYNMLNIANASGKTQIGYKYLLDRGNYTSIYEGAVRAKEAGATHFQFRPAIEPDYSFFADKRDIINNQITSAQENLDSEDFKVMGVTHKFNPDLSKKHKFDKCRATQLTSTWAADGNVYMCTDSRGNPWSKLTEHYPDPKKVIEYWGSPEHQAKVSKIDFNKNCDRCTLAPYNEFFENVFIDDKMDRNLI